jgi:hypothetical protein
MKNVIICGLLLCVFASYAGKVVVNATAPIVISSNAPEVTRYAAKELQLHLKKITGRVHKIVTDKENIRGFKILVGRSRYTKGSIPAEFERGTFVVKGDKNKLILAGDDWDLKMNGKYFKFHPQASRKGSVFAVCDFLEKFCGVRWFWPGKSGTVIEKKAQVAFPDKLSINEKPSFLYRSFFLYRPSQEQCRDIYTWAIRNRAETAIGDPWCCAHSWAYILTNKYFKKHPEYYSLIKGKRMPFLENRKGKVLGHSRQICTSNPSVKNIFIDYYRKTARDGSIKSISADDGLGFCECPKCKALDHPGLYGPADGYKGLVLSDRIFTFVNNVAKGLAKTNPKSNVGMLSYTVTITPPKTIKKIEANVVISMAQINAFYNFPESIGNKKYNRKRYVEWAKKVSQFICREYLGDFHFHGVTHPFTKIIAEDIKYLKTQKKFIGMIWEQDMDYASNHLNYYLALRLLWNSKLTREEILNDYYTKAYGNAADVMRQYFELLEDDFTNRHKRTKHGWGPAAIGDFYKPGTLTQAEKLLNKAARIANSKEVKERIAYNKLGLDYSRKTIRFFRLCQRLNDAGIAIDLYLYEAAKELKLSKQELLNLLKEAAQARKEWRGMLEKYKNSSSVCSYKYHQDKRRDKAINNYIKMLASKTPTIELPLVWKFKLDPDAVGEKNKYYAAGFDDSKWANIRTDKVWEKQGYKKYDGYAWYRLSYNVPAEYKNKKTILTLGAVDESCVVYVNGKKAGSFMYNARVNPDSWTQPLSFDVSKYVIPGKINCFAVRVQDVAGAGGLWKKAYLGFESKSTVVYSDNFKDTNTWRVVVRGKAELENISIGGLEVSLSANYPEEQISMTKLVKVSANQQYTLSLNLKIKEIPEKHSRKSLIAVRVILLDKNKQRIIKIKDYPWASLRSGVSGQTRTASKLFKTPAKCAYATITIFFQRKGKYQLNSLSLVRL